MGDTVETNAEFSLSHERLFYKIGEVARLVGVESHVIRYWERLFPDLKPHRSKSGQRVYTKREIDLLLYIKRLQYEEGYTVEGIKKKLQVDKQSNKKINAKIEIELIRHIKSRLKDILESIKT